MYKESEDFDGVKILISNHTKGVNRNKCCNCRCKHDEEEEYYEEEEVFEMKNINEEIRLKVELLCNETVENETIAAVAGDFDYFLKHDVKIPSDFFFPFIKFIDRWCDIVKIPLLFINLCNKYSYIIEEMGEKEEFYAIVQIPRFGLSGWTVEFFVNLLTDFPKIALRLLEFGFMDEVINNALKDPFSSNIFSLHFDMIIKVLSIPTITSNPEFINNSVSIISSNVHKFAEMFIDYAENGVKEIDALRDSKTNESMNNDEVDAFYKEIDLMEDKYFKQGNISIVLSTLLAACSKNEELFSCATLIISELAPCFKYFDYRCTSSLYLFIAYSMKANCYTITNEIIVELVDMFMAENTMIRNNPVFQAAATFFNELMKTCSPEIVGLFIEKNVLERFKQLLIEGNANMKRCALIFFINSLNPNFYSIMESEINDGLVQVLIDTALISETIERDDVFTSINKLIDFLIKSSLWSPDSPVAEQILESNYEEINENELTLSEQQLINYMNDLKNDED